MCEQSHTPPHYSLSVCVGSVCAFARFDGDVVFVERQLKKTTPNVASCYSVLRTVLAMAASASTSGSTSAAELHPSKRGQNHKVAWFEEHKFERNTSFKVKVRQFGAKSNETKLMEGNGKYNDDNGVTASVSGLAPTTEGDGEQATVVLETGGGSKAVRFTHSTHSSTGPLPVTNNATSARSSSTTNTPVPPCGVPTVTVVTPSTSAVKGHHRRSSSVWQPQRFRPDNFLTEPATVVRRNVTRSVDQLSCPCCPYTRKSRRIEQEYRTVLPNHKFAPDIPRNAHPNLKYSGNRIKTTKYSFLTFFPKNLFEQFHRFANLYFIFVVVLNWIPQIEAFGRALSVFPILFVLSVTAVKDAFEDWRRLKSDQKVNHAHCRVWDAAQQRYRKVEWRDLIVGDIVHLSCNEIIPADILLLRSSHPHGLCHVETSNLDGESNLKQRQVITSMQKSANSEFTPNDFKATIECEQPNNQIYRFNGFLLHDVGEREPLNKNNLLLRGCQVRNTDFVEAIVLYAGHETKAMLNNSGPRYKRSELERLTNWDIVWCVVILLLMCVSGAIGSSIWLHTFERPSDVLFFTFPQFKPELEGFINFWSYIIVLQVMIPISLYVSIELVKLGQIWLMVQDKQMYYEPVDKRIQCRALNIPEELGQIQYVMSDKTGTLTENKMIFRRCAIAGVDYGPTDPLAVTVTNDSPADVVTNADLALLAKQLPPVGSDDDALYHFLINMTICNTVVVNSHPHADELDDEGDIKPQTAPATVTEARNGSHALPPLNVTSDSVSLLPQTSAETQINNSMESGLPKFERLVVHAPPTPNPLVIPRIEMQLVDEEPAAAADHLRPPTPPSGRSISSRPSLLNLNLSRRLVRPLLTLARSSSSSRLASPAPPANPIYEAESPDELALVYAASAYGMRLLKRHVGRVSVQLPDGSRQKFQLLSTLPFDSERKRMSVVVKTPWSENPILYTKGADTAILGHDGRGLLSEAFLTSDKGQNVVYRSQQFLNLYSSYGLRTLCLAMKELDASEYLKFAAQFAEAELDIDNRDQMVYELALKLETNLSLIGVTGVEDRLQDGVADCIASLRHAGIKVWVLTGDKIETAVNIAYSSRLFAPGMALVQLKASTESDTFEMLQHHLEMTEANGGLANNTLCVDDGDVGHLLTRASSARTNSNAAATMSRKKPKLGMVVDGRTLAFCLLPSCEERFVKLAAKCTSVLCCRATPLQKASVVKLAKERLKGKCLAIGDGANDVSMIQCADVGVGISGQEGMQAVMASDFALARFRFLSRLLLVHGHWCYDRLAETILYFLYKNAMFCFTIFWYQMFNGFSSQVPIDPLYLMIHNLVFTSVPPLLLGALDQDASSQLLISQPRLYAHGRRSEAYRWYSFWTNVTDALWQSIAIYGTVHILYVDTDVNMWYFGYLMETSLVAVNLLHCALLVRSWTWPLALSLLLSALGYVLFSQVYSLLDAPMLAVPDPGAGVAQRAFSDGTFWLAFIFIVVISLLPRVVLTALFHSVWPNEVLQARLKLRGGTSVTPKRNICDTEKNGKLPCSSPIILKPNSPPEAVENAETVAGI